MPGDGYRDAENIEVGQLIAERTFPLFRRDDSSLIVTIRLGKPFQEPTNLDYRCHIQILGAGDDRTRPIWGEDPFVALQYAIDLIGQILDELVRRENLEIRFLPGQQYKASWIWRYPPHSTGPQQ